MNENNINGKIAFLRDTFLKAEKDYLEELIKKPKYKNFIEDLNKYNSKELSLEAVKRISAIESGKVKEEDLEKVETEITLLLASIQDCIREKILEKIKKTIDLNIYNNPLENEKYLLLEMKREFMEKCAIKFIEEQLEIALENTSEEDKSLIKELKDKKYDELMEFAEEKQYQNFQLIEGNIYSNDISYIANKLTIFADIIVYMIDGKILMECYADMFRYLRNLILKNSNNPIKTSAVISIIG